MVKMENQSFFPNLPIGVVTFPSSGGSGGVKQKI
jgi:hypothetical protein